MQDAPLRRGDGLPEAAPLDRQDPDAAAWPDLPSWQVAAVLGWRWCETGAQLGDLCLQAAGVLGRAQLAWWRTLCDGTLESTRALIAETDPEARGRLIAAHACDTAEQLREHWARWLMLARPPAKEVMVLLAEETDEQPRGREAADRRAA
jgi:hypothetical protein